MKLVIILTMLISFSLQASEELSSRGTLTFADDDSLLQLQIYRNRYDIATKVILNDKTFAVLSDNSVGITSKVIIATKKNLFSSTELALVTNSSNILFAADFYSFKLKLIKRLVDEGMIVLNEEEELTDLDEMKYFNNCKLGTFNAYLFLDKDVVLSEDKDEMKGSCFEIE